jgi:outer membrane lipoprotein carrier protein
MSRDLHTCFSVPARNARIVLGAIVIFLPLSLVPFAAARSMPPKPLPSASNARDVVRAFEARYRHASTLKAFFYERYSGGKGTGQAESGTVYFSRPGRMRWEYESPQKKLFIVDGTNVWFYIPDDHTASRAKLKQSSDWRTPIALLAGNADLNKICKNIALVQSPGEPDASPSAQTGARLPYTPGPQSEAGQFAAGDSVLRCAPRATSDETGQRISNVRLTISPEGYLLRVLIQQPGDISTEFRFGKWQQNLHLAEAMFHFEPPPGVEIVDEDKLAGQSF